MKAVHFVPSQGRCLRLWTHVEVGGSAVATGTFLWPKTTKQADACVGKQSEETACDSSWWKKAPPVGSQSSLAMPDG